MNGRISRMTALLGLLAWGLQPASAAATARHLPDIVYANVDGHALAQRRIPLQHGGALSG